MKKRILAMLLAVLLSLSLFAVGATAAAKSHPIGEYLYAKLEAIANLIVDKSIYSDENDDPVKRAMIALFEYNPWIFDSVANIMLGDYDKYSSYIDAQTYKSLTAENDEYVGIGITVQLNTLGLSIVAVAQNSPAYETGLRVGDFIVSIDNVGVAGKSIDEISSLIRGAANTPVTISVRRKGLREYISYTCVRRTVRQQTVYYTRIGNAAHIKITTFAPQTYGEFQTAVNNAKADGATRVIYDLRGNLGGDLLTLEKMLNCIVPEKGIELFGLKTRDTVEYFKSDGTGTAFDKSFILVDGYSASASEIFTYALMERKAAVVIGTKTYGKSVGQAHYMFYDGSVVALTEMEIIYPSGTTFNGKGIEPDIELALISEPMYTIEFPMCNTDVVFKPVTKSEYVAPYEYYLKILGYFNGEPDFTFDESTLAAYNDFRRYNGIKQKQQTDAETNRLLLQSAEHEFRFHMIETDLPLKKALEIGQ